MNAFQKLALALRTCDPITAPNNWSLRFMTRFWLWRQLTCECCRFWRAMIFAFFCGGMLAIIMLCFKSFTLAIALGVILGAPFGIVLGSALLEAYKARKG